MKSITTKGTFKVTTGSLVQVIGENRSIKVTDDSFIDDFTGYGTQLYKVFLWNQVFGRKL